MSRNGDVFSGDIGEIIIYDRALTPDEERSVRHVLRKKWKTGAAWEGPAAGVPVLR